MGVHFGALGCTRHDAKDAEIAKSAKEGSELLFLCALGDLCVLRVALVVVGARHSRPLSLPPRCAFVATNAQRAAVDPRFPAENREIKL